MAGKWWLFIGGWLQVGACQVGGGGGTGTCSTGRFVDVEEGSTMEPGGDCIACHSSGEGPRYEVAGTVMNDYPDEAGCEGVEGVTVRITDANGTLHELETNPSGNFYTSDAVPGPYTVELEYMGDTRSMNTAQTSGNCASCHTADGASGAPGRILVP